jgi:hypothetical protein
MYRDAEDAKIAITIDCGSQASRWPLVDNLKKLN